MKHTRIIAAVVLLTTSATAEAGPLQEESCSVVTQTANARADVGQVAGLKVLDRDPTLPFTITAPAGVSIKGIVCWRSEARLSKSDYLVAARYPLYIKTEEDDEDRNRTVALERTTSGFRIRLLSGPEWSDAEREEMRELVVFYESATSGHEPDKTMEPAR